MEEKTLQLFLEQFNLMRIELVGFRAEFKDFTVYIEKRFEAVEKRLGKIEVRLDKIEERLDKVEMRLYKIEERLDKVEMRLYKVEERLMIVETKLDAVMETRVVTYDDLKEYSKINKLKFTLS